MNDKVVVFHKRPFNNYFTNGFDIEIYFEGLNEAPGQYEILPATVKTPISGDTSPGGFNLSQSTLIQASSNLYYPAVPFEMLRTLETTPQITVKVDGVEAACHNLNCGYSYIQSAGSISTASFDQSTGVLTITGTYLPALSDIEEIMFADSVCNISSSSVSQIVCTLAREPTCGKWVPLLRSNKGKVPSVASPITVTCTIT